MRIIYLSLLLTVSGLINAQEQDNVPTDFIYNRVDSAICNNQIKRISYINDEDTTQYFIEFEYNHADKLIRTTTGYLKKGIPTGKYIIMDSINNLVYSLNFDTLSISYKEVRKIAIENNLNPDNITIYYGHKCEFFNLPNEGNWIIPLGSRNCNRSNVSEYDQLLINAKTGSVEKETFVVNYQPVHNQKGFQDPSFIGGEKELKNYLKRNSNYKIVDDGKHWVDVNFKITKTGKIENVTINCTNSTYHNEEAIKLVKSMPKWLPAENSNGEKIEINWEIRVNFK